MKKYLVVFDCCVVDDPYIEYIYANNVDECWDKAMHISSTRTGLSQGNFDIYEQVF